MCQHNIKIILQYVALTKLQYGCRTSLIHLFLHLSVSPSKSEYLNNHKTYRNDHLSVEALCSHLNKTIQKIGKISPVVYTDFKKMHIFKVCTNIFESCRVAKVYDKLIHQISLPANLTFSILDRLIYSLCNLTKNCWHFCETTDHRKVSTINIKHYYTICSINIFNHYQLFQNSFENITSNALRFECLKKQKFFICVANSCAK